MSSSTSGVSQSAAEPRAEALTFKVMRLNRPNFWTAAPSSGLSLLLDDSCVTTVGNSSTLCFPAGFGNIYLGETFQAYISACNNGAQHLTRLEVRAEIQTGTKRLPLLDGQAANSLLPSFAPTPPPTQPPPASQPPPDKPDDAAGGGAEDEQAPPPAPQQRYKLPDDGRPRGSRLKLKRKSTETPVEAQTDAT